MPELPEVETVRLTLKPIIGAQVKSFWWSGKNLRLNRPFDKAGVRRASGKRSLEGVRRLGKYLILDWYGGEKSTLVHLGMSGRLRHFAKGESRPSHTHVEWKFVDGRSLRYSDPRRFGQVEVLTRGAEREHAAFAKMGPDPISEGLDASDFHRRLQKTRRPIKVVLLDQSVVAGIGNIYASEALWMAKIHPQCPAKEISKKKAQVLAECVEEVLRRALDHGGTSLKDFVDADGHAGEHAHYLWVYDREGKACPAPKLNRRCGATIAREIQQQRATYYCPRCQKR